MQRVVDDTSEVPVDPLVRVLEADIAAAFIAADANTAALSQPYNLTGFQQRCEAALLAAFGDVVAQAPQWTPPVTIPAILPVDPAGLGTPARLDTGARCDVTPVRLGG